MAENKYTHDMRIDVREKQFPIEDYGGLSISIP
jgi:hypothetical protein